MKSTETVLPKTLFGMNEIELKELGLSLGFAKHTATQIYDWLYKKGVEDPLLMTNISLENRQVLAENTHTLLNDPVSCAASLDGTKKYLFKTSADRFIETAWIPDRERSTLCISTQVGCKMGCLFCATARQGFLGNLSCGQILNQYYSLPEKNLLTNIVYMGMGEPLDNAANTFKSLEILTSPKGAALSQKRITVSTIGIPEPLKELIERFSVHLAISIHSPFAEERKTLMPVQQIHPIHEIIELLRNYTFDDHRRLSFEYIMWAGVNDSEQHAHELSKIIAGMDARVNLIHYHNVPGNDLQGAPREQMEVFQNILKDHGLNATIRRSRGEDIQAACGLLSTKALSKRKSNEDF